jgi:transposase
MTFIGIDPSAESFTAARYPAATPRSFDNSAEGIGVFTAWLCEQGLTPEATTLCVENTGVYSEVLCYELKERGWSLVLIEPIKVWRAFAESRPKTDPLDSLKIAEYGYRYRDKLRLWQPSQAVVEQIKVLLSTREQLVQQKTALQNTRHALRRKVVQTPAANTTLEATISHLKAQIQALEAEIRRLIAEHPTMAQVVGLLTSVPGIGLLVAAHLLVLSEGFRVPVGYRRLANYLGIAPHRRESGTSTRRARAATGRRCCASCCIWPPGVCARIRSNTVTIICVNRPRASRRSWS